MKYIKGRLRKLIYFNEDNGYLVGIFRVKETNDDIMQEYINKTITVTGNFIDVKVDINMTLFGNYKKNERFGMQYVIDTYEVDKPSTKDALIEFLSSSFIEGCGEKTAKKIVDKFGLESIEKIKENMNNLLLIDGMTENKAKRIYNSIINYDKSSDVIIKLQKYGFSIDECSRIFTHFKNNIDEILGDGFYQLKEIIDFKKIDNIYLNVFGDTDIRTKACIEKSMEIISDGIGDTYYYQDEIIQVLQKEFNIFIDSDAFLEMIDELLMDGVVVLQDKRYYLAKYYDAEFNIANTLKTIDSKPIKEIKNIDEKLENLEKTLKINYNVDQKNAIKGALNNNISIISGGPGVGKTTIINAIVKLFISEYKLNPVGILENIALLAPTGRAAKKIASSTELPAYTIHRYLKWNKDKDEFFYNEYNKTAHKLIIVDEVSMIDVNLFNALLNGISNNVKLILVGDSFQLPSVGAGLVLNDLISSDYFNYTPLNIIYRQSNNSYIPFLAKEIKNMDLSEDFLAKKDDYSFFQVDSSKIKSMIEQIINISRKKNLNEKNMQILAPMYKGENGIDNLNVILQFIYNKPSNKKNEIKYGDIIYRENDKVLQLVNNVDNNVFNGDIGYIKSIIANKTIIDFDGNLVTYEKKDLKEIKHAYAITIHKSQGSEFEHVIMPISRSYYKMLYNKLIYTGVSRAKKSLTLVGEAHAFVSAVNNNYSANRKTSLKERIIEVYNN